jgi:Acyclic terpene utilisation family protein AtuA
MSPLSRLKKIFEGPTPPPALKVLAASGQLGYGIPEQALETGLASKPHVIAADMGSVDPGPYYLGSGKMATTPAMTKRDLTLVLEGARRLDVPLLIGSAGTAGTNSQVEEVENLIREIACEKKLRFKLAVIQAEISKQRLIKSLNDDKTTPIGAIDKLDRDTVLKAGNIVGQMGIEAFARALESGADVVLAGRACDTAPFAVIPSLLGFPMGLAMHMAKIIECSSICCLPGGRDAMLGTLDEEGFELESMNPEQAATPLSVAAHALYEQADPYSVAEPEGVLHLDSAHYEAIDERRTRVTGARWQPALTPSVKIEAAQRLGERAILLAAVADPQFIEKIYEILSAVEQAVRKVLPLGGNPFTLHFRRYGIDGVVDWPMATTEAPREVFLLGECLAETAEEAKSILGVVRQHLLHHGFEGRLSTGGNLAFPLTPPELNAGTAYRFSIYHIMELDDKDELRAMFPIRCENI